MNFDLVLGDWQSMDGVRVATTRRYELDGRLVQEVKIASGKINGAAASGLLSMPDKFRAAASRPASGAAVPYQWVIRRQFIGTYLDSDVPSYDTRATSGLRLVELAPGVQHVVGGSHHTLLVALRDSVVAFDAPVSDWHSNWVLNASRARFAGKPVKYLVLTHHHMDHAGDMDHAGGLRAYAAQGATLIVGQGTAEHYRRCWPRRSRATSTSARATCGGPRSSRWPSATSSATASARCTPTGSTTRTPTG